MIVKNVAECALECTLCGGLEGVSPSAMKNEAALLVLMARVARDHQDCEQWADNPKRARTEREYKLRMQAELRGIGC